MKIKHQSLVATAIALTLIALAFAFYTPKAQAFEGFYAGGAVGGVLSPVNHLGDKITDIVVTGGGMKIKDNWQTARKPSLDFTVKGGFGRLLGLHYSGVEASVNQSRYRMKIAKSSQNYELNTADELNLTLRDVDYAIDYKQGYLISPKTMVFAKAGLSRTRAKLSLASESVVKYADVSVKHPSYLKHEKTIHPMRIGFGVEHKLRDNVAVTCDYTYSRYMRAFKLKGQTKVVSQAGVVTANHNHRMTIQDTSIMFGLKTYF